MTAIISCRIFIFVLLLATVSCREPPTVTLPDQGTISGMYMSMFRVQKIAAYLAIPYAHPPTGQLRFAPPSVDPPPSWEGIRNATRFGPDCWQQSIEEGEETPTKKYQDMIDSLLQRNVKEEELPEEPYDEDCLLLNVYVPDGKLRNILYCNFILCSHI